MSIKMFKSFYDNNLRASMANNLQENILRSQMYEINRHEG